MAHCRQNPPDWCQMAFGDNLWGSQREILHSLKDHPITAVRSCHAAGKTYTASRAVLWFLYNHPNAVVITTAPTDRQVKQLLWAEIRSAHARSKRPLGGSVLTQEIKIDSKWWALGFTAPEYDPTRFQGFHSDYVLAVVDEAVGITPNIWDAIDGILSSGHTRLLAIANPTDPYSEFSRMFQRNRVSKIRISAFDTPNFTHYGITQDHIRDGSWRSMITGDLPAPHLISPEWVADKLEKWGETSPNYQARILAEFPEDSETTFIPLRLVESAMRKELEPLDTPNVLGVDVARYGSDETVIVHRMGPRLRVIHRGRKQDTMETVGHIVQAFHRTKAETIQVDVGGVGGGVVDRLHEQGLPVKGIEFGSSPLDSDRFTNRRTEMYGVLRDLLEEGVLDLPDDPDLASQISSLEWKPDSRGRPVLEPKSKLRDRGLPSPDLADAMVLALTTGRAGWDEFYGNG